MEPLTSPCITSKGGVGFGVMALWKGAPATLVMSSGPRQDGWLSLGLTLTDSLNIVTVPVLPCPTLFLLSETHSL